MKMNQKQYLLNFVPEITATTDPLQREIDPLMKEYEDRHSQYEEVTAADENLQPVDCPDDSQKPGCGLLSIVAIAVMIVSLILGAGFGISVLIGIAGSILVYFIKTSMYQSKVDAYEKYVRTKEEYAEKIASLVDEINKIIDEVQPKLDMRYDVLRCALNETLGIPYPESAITSDTYEDIKKCYLELAGRKDVVEHMADGKARKDANKAYIDDKLTFLYDHSLKATVSEQVYGEFRQQLLNADPGKMLMRREIDGRYSRGVSETMRLPKYKNMLEDDHLTPIIDKFEAVSMRDTTGFIFESTGKKEKQTRDLAKLCEAAKAEYDELMNINEKVSYALNYVRGCAFRNIYLATELINYISGSNRGGGLTAASDGMELSDINTEVNIGSDLNGSSLECMIDAIAVIGDAVFDNAALSQFVEKNPKVAIGGAAVLAIGSAIYQYFDNLNANAEAQKQLTDNINAIAEGYAEGKSNMLRAIEIIGGIVKCNDGFMSVYEPLRKKVFEDGDTNLTKMEIMQLAAAAKEYSNTAKAKIR